MTTQFLINLKLPKKIRTSIILEHKIYSKHLTFQNRGSICFLMTHWIYLKRLEELKDGCCNKTTKYLERLIMFRFRLFTMWFIFISQNSIPLLHTWYLNFCFWLYRMVLSPIWNFEVVVARGRFSLPTHLAPRNHHVYPFSYFFFQKTTTSDNTTICLWHFWCTVGSMPCCCRHTVACDLRVPPLCIYLESSYVK